MKKFILMMVLVLILGASAHAAWLQDNAADGTSMADGAWATLPDGDWTISCWVKQTSGVQAYSQRIYAANTITPPPVIDLLITATGNVNLVTTDAGGDTCTASTTGTQFAGNTSWTNVIAQRTGGGATAATFTVYINGTSSATCTNNAVDAIDPPGVSSFGNRYGGTLDRGLIGSMAECAKWDRALTAGEIISLSKDFAPNCMLNGLKWYPPMIRDNVELVNNATLTQTSISVTDHPRIIYCGQRGDSQI